MIIDKRYNRLLGSGGNYADVFELEGRAYKLFKSGPDIPPRQTREGRKRVFESQCGAFRLLSEDPWLQSHAALFHGACSVDNVIGHDGRSVKDDYLLACCYSLELFDLHETNPMTGLPGNEDKLTAIHNSRIDLEDQHDHLREAVKRFRVLGITVLDSSVFYHADPEKFKFIDFEIENYY